VRSDPPTHGVDGNDPSLAPHLNRFGRHTPTAKTTIFKLTLMGVSPACVRQWANGYEFCNGWQTLLSDGRCLASGYECLTGPAHRLCGVELSSCHGYVQRFAQRWVIGLAWQECSTHGNNKAL